MRPYYYVPPLDPDPRCRGLFQCALCDYGVATDDETELAEHDVKHHGLEVFTRSFGPLMTRSDLRVALDEGCRLLRTCPTLDGRTAGAEQILLGWYHIHLRNAAKRWRSDLMCTWQEFAAAADLEGLFPADVAAELRREYGRSDWPEVKLSGHRYP